MRRRGWLNCNEDVATSSVCLDARIIRTKSCRRCIDTVAVGTPGFRRHVVCSRASAPGLAIKCTKNVHTSKDLD